MVLRLRIMAIAEWGTVQVALPVHNNGASIRTRDRAFVVRLLGNTKKAKLVPTAGVYGFASLEKLTWFGVGEMHRCVGLFCPS